MFHLLTKKLCYDYSVMVILTLESAITQTNKKIENTIEHNCCSEACST